MKDLIELGTLTLSVCHWSATAHTSRDDLGFDKFDVASVAEVRDNIRSIS